MKTVIKFLVPAFIFCITGFTYSQSKGQVHFGLGSGIFNYSTLNTGISGSIINSYGSGSGNSSSSSSFSFLVGYFPIDKLRLDGGFGINAFENSDPAIYFNLGGRYFYYSNKKVMLNGGISANFGLSNGTERSSLIGTYPNFNYETKKPINLSITPVEFQFWPFEGGALTSDFTYTWVFINGGGDNNEHSLGVNVGLLIRLN